MSIIRWKNMYNLLIQYKKIENINILFLEKIKAVIWHDYNL